MRETRTATAADLLDVLLKCRIIEPKTENYGPQVKLTDIGRALLATVGTPDEPVLGNTLVPGLLVDQGGPPIAYERESATSAVAETFWPEAKAEAAGE